MTEEATSKIETLDPCGLSDEVLEQMRDLAKNSLFFLCRAILGYKDMTPEIHLPVCNKLQDVSHNRVIAVMPRTWFKSCMSSVGYPIWRAINDCNYRGLICQNTFSNAVKKLSSIRQIFEKNQLFRVLFSELLPDGTDRWSSDILTVKRDATHPEGTFEAAGTGTAVVSRHYDDIIEDDTVAPEKDSMDAEMQQPTAVEIEKAIGWHNLAVPLLTHPLKGRIIIVGTRWCEEDLIGHVQKNFPNYVTLTRAVREKDGHPATKNEGGVPAWPERFSEDVLEELERALGPYMFATLMMNLPTSAANQTFKRAWIRYFDSVAINDLICCTTVDPAASDKETTGDPDYNVVMTTGVDPKSGKIYVLDYSRARQNPGELINTIFIHYDMFSPVYVGVEAVSYQRTLKYWIEQRQKKMRKYFPVDEIKNAKTSKPDRIRGMQPFFANNLVSIRSHMADLERELLAFPAARGHDDCIDALSMQTKFWNDTISQGREINRQHREENPFSGEYILASVLKNNQRNLGYPYDMGLMKDRLENRGTIILPRSYA